MTYLEVGKSNKLVTPRVQISNSTDYCELEQSLKGKYDVLSSVGAFIMCILLTWHTNSFPNTWKATRLSGI